MKHVSYTTNKFYADFWGFEWDKETKRYKLEWDDECTEKCCEKDLPF